MREETLKGASRLEALNHSRKFGNAERTSEDKAFHSFDTHTEKLSLNQVSGSVFNWLL